MAILNETATYHDGIYRLELNTPVRGGAPAFDGEGNPTEGHSNAQAKLLADRTAWLKQAVEALLPAGAVQAFAMNTAPTGWLKANGAAVSRTTYAALFAAIGTTYGAGDGVTTFNLPDLRGEFIRGWDDGRGVDPARTFGSTQADELKSHSHNYSARTGTTAVNGDINGVPLKTTTGSADNNAETLPTGGTETRPRNIALLYCIKV